ncbi:hypothetical protein PIB30_010906 [Stylosanthes scabra]|uniref:Uncharacterized protein n=1 Tax=Stylosanthes scabra TaxID=79078 RepID=A0ABU6T5I1_9FABA|nr:hypothetical protein [Stylosanthes scabra]
MAPRAILLTGATSATAAAASSTAAAASSANPATLAAQVPPPPPTSSRAKKSSSKRERPEVVNVEGEEGAKEDHAADLRQKRRRKEKGKEDSVDRVLGEDSAWEHVVNPLELAFPKEYNYRKALDGGLTSSSVRKHLQVMLPDQLLGESWRFSCQSLACLQIGLESALAAKTKKEVEHRSALEQVAWLDEDIKVLKAQLESSQLSVSKDQKRAESAESRLKSLSASLETAQAELGKAREEANYWCTEWKSLGTEAKEMCQETLEIVLDQTCWDPKSRRIYIPEELLGDDAEVAETLPEAVVKQQQQPEQGNASGASGGEYPA